MLVSLGYPQCVAKRNAVLCVLCVLEADVHFGKSLHLMHLLSIEGERIYTDDFCNTSTHILNKVGRKLHLVHTHPLNILKKKIESSFSDFQCFDDISPAGCCCAQAYVGEGVQATVSIICLGVRGTWRPVNSPEQC